MEFPSEYAENAEPIPLAGLSGIWLRFHLLAITPLQLSAYKGSTFHGAFGWALRRLYRPLYDQLYEPASTMLPAGDSTRVALPKPFVLVPPLETQCHYPPGPMLEHGAKQALLEPAKHVTVRSHDLVWDDWARYSGRQKEWMRFGGLMGSVTYEGELSPFMPWLALGEWLHVGGKTSFGLGKYRIFPEEDYSRESSVNDETVGRGIL